MTKSSGELAGRVALVTGAAGGIGRATVAKLAEAGATIVLCDIAGDSLPEIQRSLNGSGHMSICFDVTDNDAWIDAAREIDAKLGRLDILVNNAGFGRQKSLFETTIDEWRALIAVNLDSVFLGTRHCMDLLTRSGNGAIVNVSSIRGAVAGGQAAPYSAAKGGVRIFTKATAVECAATGRKVRANSVHPGWVETPLSARLSPEARQSRVASVPQGRFAQPSEVADAIVYLASDRASYVNGAELYVDGGFTAT